MKSCFDCKHYVPDGVFFSNDPDADLLNEYRYGECDKYRYSDGSRVFCTNARKSEERCGKSAKDFELNTSIETPYGDDLPAWNFETNPPKVYSWMDETPSP